MKKTDYTHIRVPKELHEVLKSEAEARGMSIATYIGEVLGTLQSIGALSPSRRRVNIANNHSEVSNLKNRDSPGRIRTSVKGSKGLDA